MDIYQQRYAMERKPLYKIEYNGYKKGLHYTPLRKVTSMSQKICVNFYVAIQDTKELELQFTTFTKNDKSSFLDSLKTLFFYFKG